MKPLTVEAACAFKAFVRVVTGIMRVVGVEETVSLLRRAADDLEANRGRLEVARERSQKARAQA